MSYKIEKPKTEKEIIDFKAEYLQDCFQQGYKLTKAEDENYIYALEEYEELQNGKVVDISQTPEYIAEQKAKEKQDYYNKYLTKLTQYKSAIEQTRLFYDLGKLTESERDTQVSLLIQLTNQAETLYDAQIGELL